MASGLKMDSEKGKEHRYGRMGASMLGTGRMTKLTVKDDSSMQMETYMRVSGTMTRHRVVALTSIWTEQST